MKRHGDHRALLYELSLQSHVPAGYLLRAIDRFVDLEIDRLMSS